VTVYPSPVTTDASTNGCEFGVLVVKSASVVGVVCPAKTVNPGS
jgi:hypothetical protein